MILTDVAQRHLLPALATLPDEELHLYSARNWADEALGIGDVSAAMLLSWADESYKSLSKAAAYALAGACRRVASGPITLHDVIAAVDKLDVVDLDVNLPPGQTDSLVIAFDAFQANRQMLKEAAQDTLPASILTSHALMILYLIVVVESIHDNYGSL